VQYSLALVPPAIKFHVFVLNPSME